MNHFTNRPTISKRNENVSCKNKSRLYKPFWCRYWIIKTRTVTGTWKQAGWNEPHIMVPISLKLHWELFAIGPTGEQKHKCRWLEAGRLAPPAHPGLGEPMPQYRKVIFVRCFEYLGSFENRCWIKCWNICRKYDRYLHMETFTVNI